MTSCPCSPACPIRAPQGGRRYPLAGLFTVAISAVLAGAKSFVAIGEWAGALPAQSLGELGLDRAPEASTLRKLFARIGGAALDLQLAAYTWARVQVIHGRRVIGIDGKSVRGARDRREANGPMPHLVAALDHDIGVILGQVAVSAKSNEIPALRELLAGFNPADLHGCVVTVDAMHTQADTPEVIFPARAHYIFTVKANQPKLLKALTQLPWNEVPRGSQSTERGHNRRVTQTIKVTDAPAWIGFAHAAQIAQLRRTATRNGKKSVKVVYLITSVRHRSAPPAVLAAWIQGHGGIENKLHWGRDVTFEEDRAG